MGVLTYFEEGVEKALGILFPVPGQLRVDELARIVCREIERHKKKKKAGTLLPHKVQIFLASETMERMGISALEATSRLENALCSMAATRGYLFSSQLDVIIRPVTSFPSETMQIIVEGDFSSAKLVAQNVSQQLGNHQPAPISFSLNPILALDKQKIEKQKENAPAVMPPNRNSGKTAGCLEWGMRKVYLSRVARKPGAWSLPPGVQIIRKKEITLGRAFGGGGPFDIEIEDTSVSGKKAHAIILSGKDGYILADNLSANGTRVNNMPATSTPLKDKDRITIGRTIIIFRIKNLPFISAE